MPPVPTTDTAPATTVTEVSESPTPVEKKEKKIKKTNKPKTPSKPKTKSKAKPKVKAKPKTKAKKKGKKAASVDRTNKPKKLRKKGLLNLQARVLLVLDKLPTGKSLTVGEIARRAGLTTGITVQYIGHLDAKKRKAFENKYLHHDTMLTMKIIDAVDGEPRKLASGEFSDTPGATEFKINAAGRKMLHSVEGKEIVKKLKPRKPLKKEAA